MTAPSNDVLNINHFDGALTIHFDFDAYVDAVAAAAANKVSDDIRTTLHSIHYASLWFAALCCGKAEEIKASVNQVKSNAVETVKQMRCLIESRVQVARYVLTTKAQRKVNQLLLNPLRSRWTRFNAKHKALLAPAAEFLFTLDDEVTD